MTLSTAYYRRETWCLILGDKHVLTTPEDKVLKCRDLNRQETEWRCFLGGRSSPNIIRSIVARTMIWQNRVRCMGYRTGHTAFYAVTLTANHHAGGHGCDIIKMEHCTS